MASVRHLEFEIFRFFCEISMEFDKKNRNFSNSSWRTDAILKIVFGYISTPYWPINAKFGMEMTNHIQICHVTKTEIFANSRWRTSAILKIVFRCLGIYVDSCISIGVLATFNEIMKTANTIGLYKNCTQSI